MAKETDESLLARQICRLEGLKSQVKRADAMEIIRILQVMIKDEFLDIDSGLYDEDTKNDMPIVRTLLKKADVAIKKRNKKAKK